MYDVHRKKIHIQIHIPFQKSCSILYSVADGYKLKSTVNLYIHFLLMQSW